MCFFLCPHWNGLVWWQIIDKWGWVTLVFLHCSLTPDDQPFPQTPTLPQFSVLLVEDPYEIIDGYITLSASCCFSGAFMDIMLTRCMIMTVTDQHGNCSTFLAQNKLSLTYFFGITGSENKTGWVMHINYNTEHYSLMLKRWRDWWEWITDFLHTGLSLKHWGLVFGSPAGSFAHRLLWVYVHFITTVSIQYQLYCLDFIPFSISIRAVLSEVARKYMTPEAQRSMFRGSVHYPHLSLSQR